MPCGPARTTSLERRTPGEHRRRWTMIGAKTFLLGTLAMNQTRYFEAVGEALERAGHSVAYLCFHERSHEYLLDRGHRSFNAFREGAGADGRVDLSRYGWASLNLVLSHEKAAFELRDSAPLIRKLRRYLAATESALETVLREAKGSVVLVQELGGFLSNVASFYAARRRGLDCVFMEPSFFRGRLFIIRNSFGAPEIVGPRSTAASEAVVRYLQKAEAQQQVVIPTKDAHHYRGPLAKLTDVRNVRRLVEKTLDKHLFGKKEEFAHIRGHVARHVRMLANAALLARHYSKLPGAERRYVYYPLHVPADVALTIRSPQYLDQYALIDFLARAVPQSHEVFIKEHPALIGAASRRRIDELLGTRDNVRLLDPRINNYEVLRRADAVVTVNSKSGAEALLLGRPVLVLGDAFYARCELVERVSSLGELPMTLNRVLREGKFLPRPAIERYFQDVWNASWPGELHVADEANAAACAESLVEFLDRS
jgi:hypothetical protein